MTEIAYFFDGIGYTEAQQADFNARALRPQGVFADSAYGTLAVAAGGGMSVNVGAGEALVQGFYYRNDAVKNLVIAANAAGATRTDVVVLRLNRAANTLVAAVLQGVAGAGVPALTQIAGGTWEFPLAQVTVANGAVSIVAGNLSDQRIYSKWPDTAYVDTRITALEALASVRVRARATVASAGGMTGVNFGVSSVVRNSVGNYTVTLSSAMPSVSYGAFATPETAGLVASIGITSTTAFVVVITNVNGTPTDTVFRVMVVA